MAFSTPLPKKNDDIIVDTYVCILLYKKCGKFTAEIRAEALEALKCGHTNFVVSKCSSTDRDRSKKRRCNSMQVPL